MGRSAQRGIGGAEGGGHSRSRTPLRLDPAARHRIEVCERNSLSGVGFGSQPQLSRRPSSLDAIFKRDGVDRFIDLLGKVFKMRTNDLEALLCVLCRGDNIVMV